MASARAGLTGSQALTKYELLWWMRIHIHEYLLAPESLLQLVAQPTGEPLIIAAAVDACSPWFRSRFTHQPFDEQRSIIDFLRTAADERSVIFWHHSRCYERK